ncbi:MAG TPA: FxsA family protein [Phycisphaerae bacterium]|nr:FxsA family protein [Phycisphaerae bacterium]
MLLWLILLFTALPVLELALLIKIGRAIHLGPTLGLVIATGVIGAALARHQGLRTLRRIQQDLAQGRMPTNELVNGLMILVAGAVLITPGVITDAFGFALLIPPIRNLLRRCVVAYFKKHAVITFESPVSTPPKDDFIDVHTTSVSKEHPPDRKDDPDPKRLQ